MNDLSILLTQYKSQIGLSGFLLGVSWAGGQFGWGTSAVLVPMILGIATLFAFGVWGEYHLYGSGENKLTSSRKLWS